MFNELSKNQIKYIQSLKLKKNRVEQKAFVAEGDKIVSELLIQHNFWQKNIQYLIALPSWVQKHELLLQSYKNILYIVNEKTLQSISQLQATNAAIAVLKIPQQNAPTSLLLPNITTQYALLLDGINDPGNLGTIIRIADWFSITNIYCSPNCVEVFNPKTIQASMGSVWRVLLQYTDLPTLINACNQHYQHSIPVLGAFLHGENIMTLNPNNSHKGLIVIGSESHGISPQVANFVNRFITIPKGTNTLPNQATAESLNAAIATGIICAVLCGV